MALGERPSRLSAEVAASLPPLTQPATFMSTFETCGCFASLLRVNGVTARQGDLVPPGASLELRGTFEPKPRTGTISEAIAVRFSAESGGATTRTLRVTASLAEQLAVADTAGVERVERRIALPQSTVMFEVPLRKAMTAEA